MYDHFYLTRWSDITLTHSLRWLVLHRSILCASFTDLCRGQGVERLDAAVGYGERERERERILFATVLQAYQKGYKPI